MSYPLTIDIDSIFENWVTCWKDIIRCYPDFIRSLLLKNPRLIFWVSRECREELAKNFREEISVGLQNWECVFSMSKEWFVENYTDFPELKQHFITRPGLWFYMFRYDQKKINPRTGEVSKDLSDAWKIMDAWGVSHNVVRKVGNEFRIISEDK